MSRAPRILRSSTPSVPVSHEERRNSIESVDSIGLPPVAPRRDFTPVVPERTPLRSPQSPAFTSSNISVICDEEDDKLSLSSEINRFNIGQDVTITVSINNTSANSEKNAFYINALTEDDQRVVIKAYGHESDVLESLVRGGNIFRFSKVKVKNVGNVHNSDVPFDFLFTKISKAHRVAEIETEEIIEFDNLQGYIGREVKISGTITKVPEAGRNSHTLELTDPYGTRLQVRITPLSFFVKAIEEGRSYSFVGKLQDFGNQVELEVKFPKINCISEI